MFFHGWMCKASDGGDSLSEILRNCDETVSRSDLQVQMNQGLKLRGFLILAQIFIGL